MDGLVDYLQKLLVKQFGNDVSQIYYGDVGLYPPKAFRNHKGEHKAVIALIPAYDRKDPKDQGTAHAEMRLIGVDIAVLVNMTPFFTAMPTRSESGSVASTRSASI